MLKTVWTMIVKYNHILKVISQYKKKIKIEKSILL